MLRADSQSEYYNLGFAFAEGNNMASPSTDGQNGGVEFGFGDTIQYFIKGLTTASFQAGSNDEWRFHVGHQLFRGGD